jgi:Ca2+-binding EF-hand superfamily protein
VTEEELHKMFRNADLDDDGFVTQDDFYNIMTHRVYWDQK